MKTPQIMIRDLNGVMIRQNHKTGFFNANDLLTLYKDNGGKEKEVGDFLRLPSAKAFASAVLKDILQNTGKNHISKSGKEKGGTALDNNLLIEKKRGKNGGTWLHPYIFMDFAMWLSPEFKVTCIKWLYDNLIQFRDQCGDGFNQVNKVLFEQKPSRPPFDYSNEAKMINKLVFGRPDKGQRNAATERQLSLLKAMQKADAYLIEKKLDYYDRYEELKKIKEMFLLTQ